MATHTAVKQGKAWAQSVAAQTQQWKWYADEFEVGATRPKAIAYETDPLAIVLMMKIIDNKANYQIAHDVRSANTLIIDDENLLRAAADIRKYYRNKLMMQVLKGKQLSKYRMDLQELVSSDNVRYLREDFVPMLVKLPDFYEEDKMLDKFVKEYKTDKDSYKTNHLDTTLFLRPLEKHRRKTTKGDSTNYYFTDDSNKLFKLTLDPNNPCMHLFDREFNRNELAIKCNAVSSAIRGTDIHFYSVNNWYVK